MGKKKITYSALELRIIDFLKKNLSHPRFLHSIGVMHTAEEIALMYGGNLLQARLAGLLHDCARGYSCRTIVFLARQYNKRIVSDRVYKRNPHLLHGHASAAIAKRKFNIRDRSVLKAMASHTVADVNMSLLDTIIYLADKTALDRRFKGLKKLRLLIKQNLEEAMRAALQSSINHVIHNRHMLHESSVRAWNELIHKKKR